MNIEDIKSDIEQKRELVEYDGPDKVITSLEAQRLIQSLTVDREYGLTSFPTLTDVLEGFVSGELITISGLTGEGKTTIAQSFTQDFFSQDIYSLWFSYEVSTKYFLRRFKDRLPLFYMPQELSGNTITWLERRIIEAKLKYDCRIVFIDHLHYIVDMRSKNNMSLEIGACMRALKRIAVKHNVVIFLIAHLGKVRPDMEPDNQDLRDSSFIAQESDTVLIIWRKEDSDNLGTLKISKNRKTGERRKIEIVKTEWGIKEVQQWT